jgi:hypothetical protein
MPSRFELPPIRRLTAQVVIAAGALAMVTQGGVMAETRQLNPDETVLAAEEWSAEPTTTTTEEPTTTTTEAPPPTTTTTLSPAQQEQQQFEKEWAAFHPDRKEVLLCEAPIYDRHGNKTGEINWLEDSNPKSTASGGGQAINSTWRSWTRPNNYGYGTLAGSNQYSRMVHAPRLVQLRMIDRVMSSPEGMKPWYDSKGCWKNKVSRRY